MAELSSKAKMVLKRIAEGRSYEQIVGLHPILTYKDIFDSAAEAIAACRGVTREAGGWTGDERKAKRAERYPHAGEKWAEEEDAKLTELNAAEAHVAQMVRELGRSELAVKARLVKLGLISPELVPEIVRLNARRRKADPTK